MWIVKSDIRRQMGLALLRILQAHDVSVIDPGIQKTRLKGHPRNPHKH